MYVSLRGTWHLSLLRCGVVVDDGHATIAVGHHKVAIGADETTLGDHVLLHGLRRESSFVDIGQQGIAATDGLEVVEIHVASAPSGVRTGTRVGRRHRTVADAGEAFPGEVVVAEVGTGVPVHQRDGWLEEVVAASEEIVNIALRLPRLRVGQRIIGCRIEEVIAGSERERE